MLVDQNYSQLGEQRYKARQLLAQEATEQEFERRLDWVGANCKWRALSLI